MSRERILGAIIAGGKSRRFGSDKALAMIHGRPMITHVIAALRPQVDTLVICGREWPGFKTLFDRRPGHCGPLAGLEAALHHAAAHGFDAVLSVPVDTLPLPTDLTARLRRSGPAALMHQTLVGYWPTALLPMLSEHLSHDAHSVRAWLTRSGTELVGEPFTIRNMNRPTDLFPELPLSSNLT